MRLFYDDLLTNSNMTTYNLYTSVNNYQGLQKKWVESLDIDQQKYNVAKELLVKAFDSTLSSKRHIISKLAYINLPTNANPYSFIG